MKAWLFQDHRQKEKLGADCPWSVGFLDLDGKRKSKRIGSKSAATKYQRRIEGQLAAGTYQNKSQKDWTAFRQEYDAKIVPRLAVRTQAAIKQSLDHFERHIKPNRVNAITTSTIDNFISKRQSDPGGKPESKVAPATINKDLRHMKAALRVAAEWSYIVKVPKFRPVREEVHMGHVVTAEHFQAIYEACDVATLPRGLPCVPADWWRGLLLFALTTGWRIEELLHFRRDDLDLESGAIMTRAGSNKGKRDDSDYLPEAALAHVRRIAGFGPLVFTWPHTGRKLWLEFHRIQEAAGIDLPCPYADRHECTDCCHRYGFHALRRGYATLNADRMPGPVLQKKMRHKSFTTTLKYIQLSDKMKKTSEVVYVPPFLSAASG